MGWLKCCKDREEEHKGQGSMVMESSDRTETFAIKGISVPSNSDSKNLNITV